MTPHHAVTRSRRLTATAACVLLVGVVVAPAASAETVTFADAVDEWSVTPEVDVTRYRVSLTPRDFSVTLWIAAGSAPSPDDDNMTIVDIETSGDDERDYQAILVRPQEWVVFAERTPTTCTVTADVAPGSTGFTVPAACIGNPSQLRVAVRIYGASEGAETAPDHLVRPWSSPVTAGPDRGDPTAPRQTVFRFWSPIFDNAHFFTATETEVESARFDQNWIDEGPAFTTFAASGETCATGAAVHRFWSPGFRSHFYTQSEQEKNHIVANDRNWQYEGVSYCAYPDPAPGSTPLHRFWSPGFGKHFFTASQTEADHIRANDRNWVYEGVAYHVLP